MKFLAPADLTDATLSTGPVPVIDGVLTVPDDTPQGDIDGLKVAGFVPVPAKAEEADTVSAPAKASKTNEG